jgi:hypothetical protein
MGCVTSSKMVTLILIGHFDLDVKPEEVSWWMSAVDAIKSYGNEQFKVPACKVF